MKEQPRNKWNQRWQLMLLRLGLAVLLMSARTHGWVQEEEEDVTYYTDENISNATNETTASPTIAPSNYTNTTNTTMPTMAPTPNATTPSPTPSTPAPTTIAPSTAAPTTASPTTLQPSTAAPTAETKAPSSSDSKGISFWRFVEKTIAYLILLVLALLGFGGTCCWTARGYLRFCCCCFRLVTSHHVPSLRPCLFLNAAMFFGVNFLLLHPPNRQPNGFLAPPFSKYTLFPTTAFMANRYRIYFFLRGVWYTILQMECTLWLMRKLRIAEYFGYQPVDSSLNTSIFFVSSTTTTIAHAHTTTLVVSKLAPFCACVFNVGK